MTVSVVLPTVRGREALLERTRAAYLASSPDLEFVIVRDRPNIGTAWNEGAEKASGEYLHLSADDVEPQPGWLEAAVGAVREGIYPSPRISKPDWSLECCGTLGAGMLLGEVADGTVCSTSPFPFMAMEDWKAIGPSLPIGYYADDYLGWRARSVGFEVRVIRAYDLHHLEGTVGRSVQQQRAFQDRAAMLQAITEEAQASLEKAAA